MTEPSLRLRPQRGAADRRQPKRLTDVPPPLLELRHLRAGYGDIEVLHDVNVTVRAGEVLGVLGPNGAGKSTMVSVMAGLVRPVSGDLLLGGRRVTGADPARLARLGLCLIPEGRGVFPNLTVAENLWMMTPRGRTRAQTAAKVFDLFPALKDRRAELAGSLSGGQQQMLAMARALATDPAVLLFDELSLGLAPLVVAQLYEHVARIASTGVTIVVVEQFLRTLLGVATRAIALVGGQIVLSGTPDEIAPRLHSAYLSGSAR
jgi:branched-chain amino acid transport system ATP-binding protein